MKKIGILYICTGSYKLFWKDFFETSQQFLLPDFEKHYFIFTDDIYFFNNFNKSNIHLKLIENLPWPLITLFRFRYFLSVKQELSKMDYLFFSNSNMKFVDIIRSEDFLPRKEKNEHIFVVEHPGYIYAKTIEKPFERSKKSLAKVPFNSKTPYVIGAMNGGEASAFLEMSELLCTRIENDLKHNIIAQWHDESHLNKYVSTHNGIRILSPSFCYPFGIDVPFEKKIIAVSKQDKFDIKTFKGMNDLSNKNNIIKLYIKKIIIYLKFIFSLLRNEKNVW